MNLQSLPKNDLFSHQPAETPHFIIILLLLLKEMVPLPTSCPQCGNCRIFLSIRFYVKPILENLNVVKLLLLPS